MRSFHSPLSPPPDLEKDLTPSGSRNWEPACACPPISGIINLNLKTNFRPFPSHKFLNWSIPPKNTAHSPPPLDVFEKKILLIKTSTEGFHPVNKEKHSNDSYFHRKKSFSYLSEEGFLQIHTSPEGFLHVNKRQYSLTINLFGEGNHFLILPQRESL